MSDIKNDPSSLYDEEFMKKREAMFANTDSQSEVSSGRDRKTEEYEDFDAQQSGSGSLLSRFKRTFKRKMADDDDDGYDIFDLDEFYDDDKDEPAENDDTLKSGSADEASAKQEKAADDDSFDEPEWNDEDLADETNEDQTDDDVKIYEAESKSGKKFDDENADDELLSSQDMDDINALLESVGIKPLSSTESKKTEDSKEPSEQEETEDEKSEMEVQPTKRIDGGLVKKVLESSKKKAEPVNGNTRHFNIGKLFSQKDRDNSGSDDEVKFRTRRKRFIDNFRVLEKTTQDKPILERISESKTSASVVDIVEPENGEDLFDAVEKADKVNNSTEKAAAQAAEKERVKEKVSTASSLSKKLRTAQKKEKMQLLILLCLTVLSLITSIFAAAYKPAGALEFLCGNGARVYTLINLVIFIAGMAVSYDKFKDSIDSLQVLKINSSVYMLLICAFVLVQGVISLISGMTKESGIIVFSAYGLFVMLCESYARFTSRNTLIKNLSVMTHSKKLLGLQPVDNKSDAAVLGHGISKNGDPDVYYCADTDIPANPTELAWSAAGDEKLYGYGGIIVMLASLIICLVLSLAGKTEISFVSCFVGGICLCLPMMKRTVNEALLSECASYSCAKGVAVTGLDSCREIGTANAVVVDCEDIFEARVSKFRVVPSAGIAQSDAVVFAAATLKNTGSLISSAFDDFLEESGIELPAAEDVQYEERLGYSSWIISKKVLVGNREMLAAHSIVCPTKEEEERYSKGRSVMYVVVEGVIVATFIVSYYVRGEIKKSVAAFNTTGLVLIINSMEACLSESIAASKLSADIAAIKLINSKGVEIIAAYKKSPDVRVENGLLCSKKHKNVISLINAAHSLYSAQKLASLINIVGMVISFVIFAVCLTFSVSSILSSFALIIIQLMWCIISVFVGKTRLMVQ